jgi:hypothetical protein
LDFLFYAFCFEYFLLFFLLQLVCRSLFTLVLPTSITFVIHQPTLFSMRELGKVERDDIEKGKISHVVVL